MSISCTMMAAIGEDMCRRNLRIALTAVPMMSLVSGTGWGEVSRKSRKPCVKTEIIKRINEKNALYHQFVRSKDAIILSKVKKERNQLTKTLRQAKRVYFNHLFLATKRSDVMWKNLNGLIKQGSYEGRITEMEIEDVTLTGSTLAENSMSILLTLFKVYTMQMLLDMCRVFFLVCVCFQLTKTKFTQFFKIERIVRALIYMTFKLNL